GIGAQMKSRDDAKEARSRSAGGPQQVGVGGLVGVDELAVGGDHVDGRDALARPAVAAAVPSLAALKQEAADTDAGAVAAGKGAAVAGEERRQLGATLDRRAGGGDLGGG